MSGRVYPAPKLKLCTPFNKLTLSVKLCDWLRLSVGAESLNDAKLVKFSVGGPLSSGFDEVPAMPSCAATSG